jgi:AbiV family abortive infection protein
MPSIPLEPSQGRLNPDQVAFGINAARRNAVRLLEDAEILYQKQRWATVITLSILSVEEFHKTHILRSISVEREETALRKQWKKYRSHTKKNLLAHLPELMRNGARTPHEFQSLFDPNAPHPRQIEQIKQWSIYTDSYGNGAWVEPHIFANHELADYLFKTAKAIVSNREVTTKEIELWVKYVGPYSSSEDRAAGILAWFDEMKNEGILREGETDISYFVWPYAHD